MIKVGEWVLTTGGAIVFNTKDVRCSFKNKKDAMNAIFDKNQKVKSHKLPSGQYSIEVRTFNKISKIETTQIYTLTKVTESNLNRVMSMLEDN